MPSLVRTSRTSLDPEGGPRFLDLVLDRVWVSLRNASPPVIDDAWSSVEIEGGLVKAGLDMLLRPSKASRRSVTPSPLVERAKLWSETFSMCMRAGDILSSGEMPSPLIVES